jgi:hypothetical protein
MKSALVDKLARMQLSTYQQVCSVGPKQEEPQKAQGEEHGPDSSDSDEECATPYSYDLCQKPLDSTFIEKAHARARGCLRTDGGVTEVRILSTPSLRNL